jgi:asparagine synthase (glutamine-hydrolysing)
MCGIAGIYYFDRSRPVDGQLIESMNARLAHRGPNGSGVFLDGNMGLGHRRLSVIDLEGGAQPMTDGESRRTIAYNGEFFNFAEVRASLAIRGHVFHTNSDTEVLLKLAKGPPTDWIRNVNGMFAFALWDPADRSLTLVRDRFGVKPLYYVQTSQGLAFASEIKALIGIGLCPAPVAAADTLAEYLAFRQVLEPNTMFEGIRQLPAGHFLRISGDPAKIGITRYWSEREALQEVFPVHPESGDFSANFHKAVRRRLVSDVPLGSFNSGGVDSSLVTREVRNQVSGELHTFSIGFAEAAYDETPYAAEVATRLGTTHHAERLPASAYAALLPAAIWHHDEPLCHPHSVQLMHLSEIARQHVTVVLTGEGADELFFGYPRLHIPRIADMVGAARRPIGILLRELAGLAGLRRVRKLSDVLASDSAPAIDAHRFLPLETLHSLCPDTDYLGARRDTWQKIDRNQSRIEVLLEYERRAYMQSLLLRLDKMTMAHGLEARTPFLDFEMVLWSKQVGQNAKTGKGLGNKLLLKAEAEKHFSTGLVQRRKVGFGVPLREWFRTQAEFRDMLDAMASPNSYTASLWPLKTLRMLVSEHREGRSDHTEALWALLNIELWSTHVLQRSTCT